MNFEQAQNEYLRLKSQLESKQISPEAFEEAVNHISVTDSQGRQWTIGVESGKWYLLENSTWVEATPPARPPQKNKRSALIWVGIGGAVILGVLSLVFFGSQYVSRILTNPGENEQVAVITEEVIEPSAAPLLQSSATTEPPTVEPTIETGESDQPVEDPTTEDVHAGIPDAPLSPDGPWLVFLAEDGIWALNPDGSGLTHVVDEIVVAPTDLRAGINGSYLAYVSADDAFTLQNMTLKIVKLPGGTIETITPLLAPENQPGDSPEMCDPKREAARAVTIYNGLAWSRDGSQLGFIGALEGPTADLYLYTPEDGEITRLTDGPSQAHSVNWSRSGEYIIHFGASCFGTGAGFNMDGVWASDVETGDVITLYQPGEESYGEEFVANYWGAEDAVYVITHSGCPASDLRVVDVQTQEVSMVHEGCFWDYVVYPPEIIAVLDGPDFSEQPGLHLYSAENFQLLNYTSIENGQELGRYENMFLIKSVEFNQNLPEIRSVYIADGSSGWYQGQGDFPLKKPGLADSYAWLEGDNFYFLPEDADQPILLSDQGASYPLWVEDFSGESADIQNHLLYFTEDDSGTLYIVSEPDFTPVAISGGLMPEGEIIQTWSSD